MSHNDVALPVILYVDTLRDVLLREHALVVDLLPSPVNVFCQSSSGRVVRMNVDWLCLYVCNLSSGEVTFKNNACQQPDAIF